MGPSRWALQVANFTLAALSLAKNICRHAGRGSPVKRACVAMSLVLALLGALRAALKARSTERKKHH